MGAIDLSVQERESFLQVERGADAFQPQAELDHCKCHFRLDADDHGFTAAQANHVGELAQCLGRKGVHDVECRDVDDNAVRARAHHLLNQRRSQLPEIGVRQRRLDGRDQYVALLENRDFHVLFCALLRHVARGQDLVAK